MTVESRLLVEWPTGIHKLDRFQNLVNLFFDRMTFPLESIPP